MSRFARHPFRGLLLVLAAAILLDSCTKKQSRTEPSTRSDGAPVIIISIDTLRADHLPLYGYSKVETPAIDALARDAVVFENAYAHCPLTLPSHVSMLTGLLPTDHGVRSNLGFSFDSKKHPSIPSLLRERGYATGAAVSAYVLRGNTGLRDAFDFYDDGVAFESGVSLGDLARQGDGTVANAEQWLRQQGSRPFFLFLHLFEPHAPYAPSEEFRVRYAASPYDGEIATVDAILGRFIGELKKREVYDRSLIILMSDHGEGLGDHGEQEHGIFLYREAIRVPLIVKLPSSQRGGTRVAAPVQLIDILPTISAVTGCELPATVKGTSLLAQHTTPRRIFSETMYPRIHLGMSDLRSLVGADFQLIDAPRPELYDIASDPAQQKNILGAERRIYAEMKKEIDAYDRSLVAPSNIAPEDAQKLAALGYVGSASISSEVSSRDPKDFIGEIESLRVASQLAAEGNLDEAIARFRELVAKNPNYTDAWAQLARTLESAERFDEAASAYKRILVLVPTMTEESALSLASIYLNQNRLDDATSHAELALGTNPGAAHLLLGRIALARRDYPAAESEARLAGEDEHFRIQSQVLRSQALTKMNRIPEALAIVESAKAELESKHLRPVLLLEFARGDALVRLGKIPEAEEAFRSEIRQFPADRQTYAHLAALYYLQGRKSEAAKTLSALASANPDRESYRLAWETTAAMGDAEAAATWKRRFDAASK